MTREAMMLSTFASKRLETAPQPGGRYGLSVMLRKPYPDLREIEPARDSGWDVHATDGRMMHTRAAWEELPHALVELLKQRVSSDSMSAAHIVKSAQPQVLHVPERTAGRVVLRWHHEQTFSTLILDVGSSATVVVDEAPARWSAAQDVPDYRSTLVALLLRPGARATWGASTERLSGVAATERLAVLEADATLELTEALVGVPALHAHTHVSLQGPGARTTLRTLCAGGASDQFDVSATAEHRSPHTTSDVRTKCVLSGRAQAVLRGLVRIAELAPASDGFQRMDTLLLSPKAEVDPVPTLEINTNDVRCTHGVTVSHLNPDQLFYLQSRGLKERAARDLIVDGFVRDALRTFDGDARETLSASVRAVLTEEEEGRANG